MQARDAAIKRVSAHLGYCPHSTPEDEAAGLAVLDLAKDLTIAQAYRRYYMDDCIERGFAPHEASEEADDFERRALLEAGRG